MRIETTFPGARSSDPRNTVTFRDDGLPLPLRLHFLRLHDTDTNETTLRVIGLELGEAPRDEESALSAPELTALTLRRVVERYPHWVELAQVYLGMASRDELASRHAGLKRRKPARLDPDWFRMIAAEYRRHVEEGEPAPVTAIGNSHGVTRSAASRWVTRAREMGLLDG
jgi:hypothetical protein